MLRIIGCSVILAAFAIGLGHVLTTLSRSLHIWSFMVMGGALCAIILFLTFCWDWIERRRAQQLQLSALQERKKRR
jgi:hypothetical protein